MRSKAKRASAVRVRTAKKHKRIKGAGTGKILSKDIPNEMMEGDLEGILTKNLVEKETQGTNMELLIQDILYSSTPSMRQLAYHSGFSIGKDIYSKSNGNEGMIFTILERIGFGKVLYYPFEESLLIKSTSTKSNTLNVNNNIHVFESGIIAGYLSASTGMKIDVQESQCLYNNHELCLFVATPSQQEAIPGNPMDLESITDVISKNMDNHNIQHHEDYYLLSMLPILKQPLQDQVSNLLYVIGSRLAVTTERKNGKELLRQMADMFDIKDVKVLEKRSTPSVVTLRYKPYNSIEQFVNLSAPMLAGFVSSLYNREAKMNVYRSRVGERGYTVKLELGKAVS